MIFILFLFLFLTTFFLLKRGDTALHTAAWKGFEQIVKILVEHGSNINIQNEVFIFFLFFWGVGGFGVFLFFFETFFPYFFLC